MCGINNNYTVRSVVKVESWLETLEGSGGLLFRRTRRKVWEALNRHGETEKLNQEVQVHWLPVWVHTR
jgi:hypothetical protein